MGEATVHDLLGIDREVARAVGALERWRARIDIDPVAAADDDPFDGLRRVAAQSTAQALLALNASTADVPLRDALVRWVESLVQARIGLGDEMARASARSIPNGRFEGEPPRRVTWREAWRGLVSARAAGNGRLWLSAASDVAPAVGSANRTAAARRLEVSHRLGHPHPWEPLVGVQCSVLRATALRLLDGTEDLSRAVFRETLGASTDMADRVCAAVAREAGDGWPAHLSSKWFEDAFGEGPRGMPIRLGVLPRPLGAASFARALYSFGHAVRLATVPRGSPFALSSEPAFVGAHRLGFVFGGLASQPEFHRRVLGLGRRASHAQSRLLARTALLDARVQAARILLQDDASPVPLDVFAEVTARLFGRPIDPAFRGAWPGPRPDEPARMIAIIQSHLATRDLRDRFEIDWFRNPRAWFDLRVQGTTAAREIVDGAALETAATSLALSFEEALG